MAYDGHNGVMYRRYDEFPEDEDMEPVMAIDAMGTLDELYYESYSGNLCVTAQIEDEYVSLEIPVKADKDWNEFVESLPKWE